MSQWQALNPKSHQDLGWLPYADYTFAAADTFAPVVVEELPQLLAYYPLCFIQQEAGYQFVALQSLTPKCNVYVSFEGKWLAPYVPAFYRSYPFRFYPNPQAAEKQVLCFDAAYPGITPLSDNSEARPFFNDQGEPAQHLTHVIEFLQKVNKNRLLTQRLVDQLQQAQLIEPWSIQIQSNGAPISGLYRISEAALKESAPETVNDLLQSGALGLAYGQLYSQARLKDFKRRYEHRESQKRSQRGLGIEDLFDRGEESLRFDF
ncbi:hypothetical protein CKO15_12785 [Halorhodospira abdelmalekii]|uniref:SapC family protein n=1 Tax=Halorhodospira abdelmalekii TaxID=421629 RepID=UPI001906AB45|nr:SapC family protein [Halorhodospira abdelmalekii]MBK1736130.1 hypothetical protein [Halorhodospira abdelmalekii]